MDSGSALGHRRYALILLTVFGVIWAALAIDPLHRDDWMLENALVVVFLAYLAGTHKVMPLSRISYTLIFVYMCLHEIGAHYTYAEVPYDRWFSQFFGSTLNEHLGWERNNFDRIIHFTYGLLLAYPIREIVFRVANVRGFWAYFLPLDITMSTSMLYELIEWGAASGFGGDLGMAYLGTQGDIWDAQKDMLVASIGALLAMLLTALLNIYLQRDFAREWIESLRVKHQQPLGEDEIARLWKSK